jgi:RimJ/RimL family protein N-acetyltransferase
VNKFSLRQLGPEDWLNYRQLRRESLAKHPAYFCPSRDESKFTEAEWRERLSNSNAASFGLFAEGKLIGLTGIVREGGQPNASRAHLVSSYIQQKHRKLGLSKLFFEARFAWARAQGNITTLVLEHRDDNLASQKAHEKFGFRFVKSHEEKWPDGEIRPALVFEREI